jgi:hypothetical protein
VTDWHTTHPAYYFDTDRWSLMARPSVHEGREQRQKVERQVDDLFARLLGAGGDWATAVHESGHAFVAWRLGCRIDEVRLDGAGGETRFRDTLDDDGRSLALLAGALAERAILGEVGDGCDDDAEKLARCAPYAAPDVVARAQSLVEEGRTAIEHLAAAAVARRSVPGGDVAAILAEHSPDTYRRPAGELPTITVVGWRRNVGTGVMEEYRGTQAVSADRAHLWPPEAVREWNAMQDVGPGSEAFRRHQARLCGIQAALR